MFIIGVVSHYFAKRWDFFMSEMYSALVNNTSFNEANVTAKMFKEVEEPFTMATNTFPDKPQGNNNFTAKMHFLKLSSSFTK